MGGTSSKDNYRKSIATEQVLIKKTWSKVEDNLQYHANVFFTEFCEAYPQYVKYFTFDPDMPLTLDADTSKRFMIIMETMGYLLIYFLNKPKQVKHVIGYVAMVHKDMDITRADMTNFRENLIKYITSTFPKLITSENENVIAKYIRYITDEISQSIEDFKKNESRINFEFSKSHNGLLTHCLCREKLIYGCKLDYWNERKRVWEERLEEWKLKVRTPVDPSNRSSTDEDIMPIRKSKFEDAVTDHEESIRVWEPRDSSGTGISKITDDSVQISQNRRRVTLKMKKSGQTNYDVIEIVNPTEQSAKRQQLLMKEKKLSDNEPASTSVASSPLVVDSEARKRRRQLLSTLNND
ncbi:uncharacterized protein LOC103568926 [Microplitis demolitor]|uniref:uncharacterized protein LOC103568926 n=1 Tax=Microplitis demolitor TaxID=69319 RepID=UPI0004CD27D3|nr:uncharacterized protein LOC103568926 [Microplitis demolitor]